MPHHTITIHAELLYDLRTADQSDTMRLTTTDAATDQFNGVTRQRWIK